MSRSRELLVEKRAQYGTVSALRKAIDTALADLDQVKKTSKEALSADASNILVNAVHTTIQELPGFKEQKDPQKESEVEISYDRLIHILKTQSITETPLDIFQIKLYDKIDTEMKRQGINAKSAEEYIEKELYKKPFFSLSKTESAAQLVELYKLLWAREQALKEYRQLVVELEAIEGFDLATQINHPNFFVPIAGERRNHSFDRLVKMLDDTSDIVKFEIGEANESLNSGPLYRALNAPETGVLNLDRIPNALTVAAAVNQDQKAQDNEKFLVVNNSKPLKMLLDDLTACDRELTEHQNTLRDKTDDHEQKVSQLRSLQDENYALNIHASLESLKSTSAKDPSVLRISGQVGVLEGSIKVLEYRVRAELSDLADGKADLSSVSESLESLGKDIKASIQLIDELLKSLEKSSVSEPLAEKRILDALTKCVRGMTDSMSHIAGLALHPLKLYREEIVNLGIAVAKTVKNTDRVTAAFKPLEKPSAADNIFGSLKKNDLVFGVNGVFTHHQANMERLQKSFRKFEKLIYDKNKLLVMLEDQRTFIEQDLFKLHNRALNTRYRHELQELHRISQEIGEKFVKLQEQLAAMIIKPAKLVVVPQINAKQLMQRLRHLDIDEVNQPAIVVQTTIRAASQARALTEVSRAGARYRTIGARVQPRTGSSVTDSVASPAVPAGRARAANT